jgi:molybdopterin-containing oxidoreductase family iron-sulfur binding subunit
MPPLSPAPVTRASREPARRAAYWRSLDERLEDAGFRAALARDHPQLASMLALDRRGFLRFMAASLALAGLGACSGPPPEEIVPYLRYPRRLAAGDPGFFATALVRDGYAVGVLAETNRGRPTRIEGNPDHPASLGATGIGEQAAVLDLWDPDRSQAVVRRNGEVATWDDCRADLALWMADAARDGGARLRVVTPVSTSPTLAAQMGVLLKKYPRARWHFCQAVGEDTIREGTRLAFGEPLAVRWRFDRARVILALDADFLTLAPGRLRYAREFAAARRVMAVPPAGGRVAMNRLYAIESTPSLTGSMADHRLPLAASRIEAVARQLAARLGVGAHGGTAGPLDAAWLDAVATDLETRHGASLVVAGVAQPACVHALVHAINAHLGNHGSTVVFTDPVEAAGARPVAELPELARELAAGAIDTLLLLDVNPACDAPADLALAAHIARAPHTLHLGLHRDETALRCAWHVPMAHALEAWSDARADDGSISLVQPVIAPLYDGRSPHEVLAAVLGSVEQSAHALVRAHWQERVAGDFDAFWTRALQDGVIAGSALPERHPRLRPGVVDAACSRTVAAADAAGLEVVFRPDATLWDGRQANNGWLQELPKPLTQLTWSNAAMISPALAAERGLADGDVVELAYRGRRIEAPVWILPGQAARSVTLPLGYGRSRAGRVGTGLGFDAGRLRSSAAPWFDSGLALRATGRHIELAATQQHFRVDGDDVVRRTTLAAFLADPGALGATDVLDGTLPSFYPETPRGNYTWGMAIDLNACIGCKACTIACQAENNIPVVGAAEVRRGREMHWIRVDRYYRGEPANPSCIDQPVPCMHCAHAPCELVCPVGATVHDSEGLNLQVYNRCIGTRFCSNNCPYKVRRFNFLQYTDTRDESLKGQRNPEVSVRRRGVMEKCTYCIQRIEAAHVDADREGRRIGDGAVVTACQAVCPTRAIVFGDMGDPASAVSRAKASPRNYAMLAGLGTRPRTSYLARLGNPHPGLGDS